MNFIPLEFSIVVVGEDCNPTILNPDFLRCRDIVPEEWGWELSGPPITNRAFSIVPYDSGVMIKVELNRFQITQIGASKAIGDSKIIEVARRYIGVLPHVRYTAVGNNFRAFSPMEKPNEHLKDRFIKSGLWNDNENPLVDVTLSLIYAHEGARVALSLESQDQLLEHEDKTHRVVGIEIGGNYHRECNGYPTDAQVISHIEKAISDFDHFQVITTNRLLAEH
jgi:hypothetical protein